MSTTSSAIKLKKSSVPEKVPQTSDLDFGELAINYADGKLYFKNSSNEIDFFTAAVDQGNAFTTIAFTEEDNIVADSSTDTLNIASNDYITLSTNASTNTITFSTNHDVEDTSETLVSRGTNNEFGISRIDFSIPETTAFNDPASGQVQWSLDDGTLEIGLDGSSESVLPVGQKTIYKVSNKSGSTITKGTLCMFGGTVGQSSRLLVVPWNGTSPSQLIMGIANEDILDDEDGFVVHFGRVRKIDTTGTPYSESWANGDILYAAPAGGMTKVKPEAPSIKTIVAVVINSHQSVGSLFVRPTFSSNLDDDDLIELDNLQDKNILQYISARNRFENISLDSAGIVEKSGNQTIEGTKTFSSTITGSVSGNSGTATTLQTARNINGTSFDGSANITTLNWGTSRTLTIGSSEKSVDGGSDISWSLSEIGVNNSTLTLATSGIATGSQTWTSNQGANATFTVDVPATNIAEGTRTTTTVPITSSTGTDATLSAATTSLAGVMSSADKTKLDGIATGAQTGTVTSVGGTGTVSGLTLSGTVTTTGNITLGGTLSVIGDNFGSQTANRFLAAPNGSNGNPSFRAIVAADIPTLNQNTTGTAANVTGTVVVGNGGTGQTSYTNGQLLIGNTTGNTLTKATLTAGNRITITNGTGSISIAADATNLGITAGTTAGPVVTSSTGNNATLPTASATASGVVTTGDQTWAGVKTFSSAITITGTSNAAGRFYAGTTNPSNTTRLNYDGNLHVRDLNAVGDVNSASDIILKKDVHTIKNAMNIVSNLRGVHYTWKESNEKGIGVIAQEVEQIVPEVVSDSGDYKSVSYGNLVGILIEAIKEQQEKIEHLEKSINSIKEKME